MADLTISEVFGPTIQGEGPTSGEPCAFVRTSNCNLDCVWCDTPYTWDWTRFNKDEEQQVRAVNDIAEQLQGMGVKRAVFSGGEPLLQQAALAQLATTLTADGWIIEVETNGTIPPTEPLRSLAHFNVSIKLPHAQTTANSVRPVAIRTFNQMVADGLPVYFKWVAAEPDDLDRIDTFVKEWQMDPDRTWIMPLGTTAEAINQRTQTLATHIVAKGFHATTRLHVLMWGDQRGH